MNLYLVSHGPDRDDAYDAMVVAAESEEDARSIHPSDTEEQPFQLPWDGPFSTWCASPSDAKAELIGEATRGTKRGVILASFNAG